MRICSCGFANNNDASVCAACGSTLLQSETGNDNSSETGERDETPPMRTASLVLRSIASDDEVEIPYPGGIIGRAGKFNPEVFSGRVSGTHAIVAANEQGTWTIEHIGRNASAIRSGSVWVTLAPNKAVPLLNGDVLKLADMVFKVELPETRSLQDSCSPQGLSPDDECARAEDDHNHPNLTSGTDQAGTVWIVTCPVCGTGHIVENENDRVTECSFCTDAFDKTKIARISARRTMGDTAENASAPAQSDLG